MGQSISCQIEGKVISLWLQGYTRDEIAMIVQISAGSVSNIIARWQKELDDTDYPAVRDTVVQLRKHGMSARDCAEAFRLKNLLMTKLGAGGRDVSSSSSSILCSCDNLEAIITNIVDTCIDMGLPKEKLSYILLQVFELSNNESIHPVQLPYYLSKKIQEKKQLEQDIEKLRKLKQQAEKETNEALQKRNLTNDAIKEHINVREELEKLGIPLSNIQKTINAIKNTLHLGYEPSSIAAKFASISSLEERERALENRCMLLKQKADRYQQIFDLCEQIAQLGINSDQIESLVKTIIKIATRNNSSGDVSTTIGQETSKFSSIIGKYDTVEKLDTLEKSLTTQIDTLRERLEALNKFWAYKNHIIRSLIRLYGKGIRDKYILYIHDFFSKYYNKIKLESLSADLEKYVDLHEALEELFNEKGHLRMEISLLQEKKQSIIEMTDVMHLKTMEMMEMMEQLAENVAKAAAAFNLPSPIFGTYTKIIMLSNIFHQKSEEKEKTAAIKITRYNSDGKAVL